MPAGVNSPVRAFRSVGGDPHVLRTRQRLPRHRRRRQPLRRLRVLVGPVDPRPRPPRSGGGGSDHRASMGSHSAHPAGRRSSSPNLSPQPCPTSRSVRFVSSGTEAVMSAIRLARGATGRDVVLKFDGCYHGHADHLLVSAGSGLATFGTPSSAGVPESFARHTAVLPLDDDEAFLASDGGSRPRNRRGDHRGRPRQFRSCSSSVRNSCGRSATSAHRTGR